MKRETPVTIVEPRERNPIMRDEGLHLKHSALRSILSEMGSVAIGFSGGIDSTLLIRVATETLGERALAVIGRSETYPSREFEEAI